MEGDDWIRLPEPERIRVIRRHQRTWRLDTEAHQHSRERGRATPVHAQDEDGLAPWGAGECTLNYLHGAYLIGRTGVPLQSAASGSTAISQIDPLG